ncbi:MAG: serine/threonine-protein phosphatase [Desulfobacterales bacterium]|nr:serine/threonine-protein phosphatase [Desulfobacterales bacterium]
MTIGKTIHFNYTNQGIRTENQDNFAAYVIEDNIAVRNLNRGELFVVADGMGGHKSGKEAAIEVCSNLFDVYYTSNIELDFENPESIENKLEQIINEINMNLVKKSQDDIERSGWGSTISVLILRDQEYYFAHSGDTRIYLFNDFNSTLLTEDHNVGFQLYKYKQTTYEKYLEGKGRNKLLSYMGQGDGISIQTGHGTISDKDIFLICSDGLNQFAEIMDMERILNETKDVNSSETFIESLYVYFKNIIKPEEAKDNVTFMLVSKSM